MADGYDKSIINVCSRSANLVCLYRKVEVMKFRQKFMSTALYELLIIANLLTYNEREFI
jgi:hypothetical protein